jgi:hypothetical protein
MLCGCGEYDWVDGSGQAAGVPSASDAVSSDDAWEVSEPQPPDAGWSHGDEALGHSLLLG